MPVSQALVAVGGRATRLGGVEVSKAFLPGHGGRTFLHWCLTSLRDAGITRIVLAAHADNQVERAHDTAARWQSEFEHVEVFRDAGLGVHGIPHQAQHLLDEVVLFEAGHGVNRPGHHRALIAAWRSGTAVFSAFPPRADNPRFAVRDHEGHWWALAHPMVIDSDYIEALPGHGYTVDRIAGTFLARGRLRRVVTSMPVEFDIESERRRALRRHVDGAHANAAGCPWPETAPTGFPVPTTPMARPTPTELEKIAAERRMLRSRAAGQRPVGAYAVR